VPGVPTQAGISYRSCVYPNMKGLIWVESSIAIFCPPKAAPLIIVIYYSRNKKDAVKREDVLASATCILINEFAPGD
jgi:hypothetical protein